jgi:hypothetical protein
VEERRVDRHGHGIFKKKKKHLYVSTVLKK